MVLMLMFMSMMPCSVWSLPRGPMRNVVHSWHCLSTRVHAPYLASAIQGYHLLLLHARLAHRTFLTHTVHLQPAVEAWPTEQMPAKRHYGVLGELQTYVAIEAPSLLSTTTTSSSCCRRRFTCSRVRRRRRSMGFRARPCFFFFYLLHLFLRILHKP